MRTLVMVMVGAVVVLGGAGCRKRVPKIFVPQTEAGLKCERECMLIFHACQGGRGQNAKVCAGEGDRCMRTCPGATYEDGTPVIATAPVSSFAPEPPPAPLPVPAGQSCVASQLPEWRTASAAEKKALLAKCRAPPAEPVATP